MCLSSSSSRAGVSHQLKFRGRGVLSHPAALSPHHPRPTSPVCHETLEWRARGHSSCEDLRPSSRFWDKEPTAERGSGKGWETRKPERGHGLLLTREEDISPSWGKEKGREGAGARGASAQNRSHNTPGFLLPLQLLLPRNLLFLLWGCCLLLEGSPLVPLSPPLAGPLCLAPLLFPQLFSVSPAPCLLPPGRPRAWAAPSALLLASLSSAPARSRLGFDSPLARGSPSQPVTCRGRKWTVLVPTASGPGKCPWP